MIEAMVNYKTIFPMIEPIVNSKGIFPYDWHQVGHLALHSQTPPYCKEVGKRMCWVVRYSLG